MFSCRRRSSVLEVPQCSSSLLRYLPCWGNYMTKANYLNKAISRDQYQTHMMKTGKGNPQRQNGQYASTGSGDTGQSEGYSITETCSVCIYIYVFFLRKKKWQKKSQVEWISEGVSVRPSGVRPSVRPASVRPSVRPKKKLAPKIFFKMQELWFFHALITSRIVV